LIGLTLLALSFLSVTPTHAGSWSVTYDTAGTNTGEIDRGQSAEYLVGVPWEVASPSNHIFLDMTSPPWGSELDDIRTEGDVTAVLTWTGGPGDNPPATIYVRETASATSFPHGFPIQVYDAGGLTPVVATTDDGLGDSPKLSAPADEWSASSGSHLTQISTQGQRVVRLPKHHMLASIHYDDPLAYDAGLDGEQEYVNVDYSAALDTRAAMMTPLGHEVTSHRVLRIDENGNPVFITPLSQFPDATVQVAEPKLNTTLGSDRTMPVDIGMPIHDAFTTGSGWYQIDYSLLAIPDFYVDDVWKWKESLYGYSSGDTIYATSFGTTDIPNQTVKYNPPVLNINASHRTVAWYDADSTDLVDFNYTFASDKAQADAHLLIRFHRPDENWISFKTYKQQDADVKVSQYATDPPWLSPQVGYTLTVTRPGSDYETLVNIEYGLGGAALAAASAVTDGLTSAFLAAVGFDYGLNPPQSVVDTFTNNYSNFQTAATATRSGDIRVTPSSLAVSATEADWGSCEFSVWHKALTQNDYWVGDHYGGVGYTGQVYKVTQKPYSWPYEFHYQLAASVPAPQAAR